MNSLDRINEATTNIIAIVDASALLLIIFILGFGVLFLIEKIKE